MKGKTRSLRRTAPPSSLLDFFSSLPTRSNNDPISIKTNDLPVTFPMALHPDDRSVPWQLCPCGALGSWDQEGPYQQILSSGLPGVTLGLQR